MTNPKLKRWKFLDSVVFSLMIATSLLHYGLGDRRPNDTEAS